MRKPTAKTTLGPLTVVAEVRGSRVVFRPAAQYAKYLKFGGQWR